MVSGRIVLLFASVFCIGADSSIVLKDDVALKKCVKEFGRDIEQREDAFCFLLNTCPDIRDIKKGGKCLMFCLAHELEQVDENGRLLPGKFDDVPAKLKPDIKKCEEEVEKYQDKCERVFQMVLCVQKQKSTELYWEMRDVFEKDHFTFIDNYFTEIRM